MWRKVAAVLVMVLSVIGVLICLAVVVGAWVLNEPATTAITTSLDTADDYVEVAEQATEQVDSRLSQVQSLIQSLTATAPERAAEARATVEQKVAPVVSQVQETITVIQSGIATANQLLTQFSRLPGVNVPSLSEQLGELNQRITQADSTLDTLTSALADKEFDSSKVSAAVNNLSARLAELRVTLDSVATRLASAHSTIATASSATPAAIDKISIVVSLLGLLLGAGQVSLFMQGLNWFRRPEPQPVAIIFP